jgi:hypothetical protein
MMKGKKSSIGAVVLLALMILPQFIPVTRDNPPVGGDFDERQDVRRILRHICYNCHSNETSWPWYSSVAPISWLIAHDVSAAREHLNFSDWKSMPTDDQALAKKEIWQEIERGDMPPGRYVLMHSDAKLSETDKSVIRIWAAGLPSKTDSGSVTSSSYPEGD